MSPLRGSSCPFRLLLSVLALSVASGSFPERAQADVVVSATVETDPMPTTGEAADDAAIWIHPEDPARSVIIGTDKHAGAAVYDLAGNELQFVSEGALNNVDLRYGFALGGELVDIAAASNRTDESIVVYRIDRDTGFLTNVTAGGRILNDPGGDPKGVYGLCLYRSPFTGKTHVFVNSKGGRVRQWELADDGLGQVTGTLVRDFDVGKQTEGCVADDEEGFFYVGEEAIGIWRYGAEPETGEVRVAIDSTEVGGGHLIADVEGLTIYYESAGVGYLIASSQGSDEYVLYERTGDNAYVGRFRIGDGNGIDATSGTDGIDVSSAALGSLFPRGLFVVQDGNNQEENQNFKLVPWETIANAFTPPLRVDTGYDPRPAACGDGFDNDADSMVDFPADPDCESLDGRFEQDPSNLLANPDFHGDLHSWSYGTGSVDSRWDPLDLAASTASGSALLVHEGPTPGGGEGLAQCVAVESGASLRATAWIRIPDVQDRSGNARLALAWSEDGACGEPWLEEVWSPGIAASTGWQNVALSLTAPVQARSLRIAPWIEKDEAGSEFAAHFDSIFAPEPAALVQGLTALAIAFGCHSVVKWGGS
jgi:3-phytase